jgi:hypothetical protein
LAGARGRLGERQATIPTSTRLIRAGCACQTPASGIGLDIGAVVAEVHSSLTRLGTKSEAVMSDRSSIGGAGYSTLISEIWWMRFHGHGSSDRSDADEESGGEHGVDRVVGELSSVAPDVSTMA